MPELQISPDLPAPAGPYSHVAIAHSLVWTAGFGPHDPITGQVPDGVEAQTAAVLDNVQRALAAVGLDLSDVVKVTVHLEQLKRDFAAFNGVYAQRFGDHRPVRTTVGSDLMNILVEIDVVAAQRS